jgi:3-hydroxyacyl-[acyl-carrier-protein] dehydratase
MNLSNMRLRFAPDHPALAGHFPQHPIIPGVLLLDEALHVIEAAAQVEPPRSGTHWHIANVKFHRPVQPGESLRLDCTEQESGMMRIELHADEVLVASASIEQRP